MSSDFSSEPSPLLVACLCAQWCGTCRDYQPLFTQLQAELPQTRFMWVDVEDESELVDPVEVENFPTLLIARHGKPLFFGTATPHLETLKRLIQNYCSAPQPGAQQSDDVVALAKRLTARLTRDA
jgi:thiol-disulfide isomerase/thioredoxin